MYSLKYQMIRITIIFAVVAVLYYSYVPLLYVTINLPISKDIIFIIILGVALSGATIFWLTKREAGKKKLLLTVFLYMVFALYALISFMLTENYFNDFFNIRTVTVINILFITLALFCRKKKELVIKVLYVLSGSYFLFGAVAYSQGAISIASDTFQGVFSVTEKVGYQGINLYLGLFALLNIFMFRSSRKMISIILLLLSIITILMMFLIGGRASFVGLVVTIAFYIYLYLSSAKSKVKSFAIIFILAACLVIGSHYIMDFISTTVTFRRFTTLDIQFDSSQRIYFFGKAIELFMSSWKTVLYGGGINSYPVYINSYGVGSYPHNILLELLAEYGMVGTLLFFAPIIYIIKIRKVSMGTIYGDTFAEKVVFLLAIYFWTIHMVTGGLRTSWTLIFFTFLLMPSRIWVNRMQHQ